jgi:site-specific recombinase XerD
MASALREQVILQLNLRGLSPATHTSYLHAMEEMARYFMRPLETLTCAEVQEFLNELIAVRKLAWSTVNVYFSAYRFLYNQVLERDSKEFSIPPRGRSGTRPGVLSREEVVQLLNAPQKLKDRALLSMVYGSGLRVSIAANISHDPYNDSSLSSGLIPILTLACYSFVTIHILAGFPVTQYSQ